MSVDEAPPGPAPVLGVSNLGFLGVRVAEADAYAATVTLHRELLGLPVIAEIPGRYTWFRLRDGTQLHVYGPLDQDHVALGDSPCVGLVVDDVDGVRDRMEAAGIEFLWPTQRDGGRRGRTTANRTAPSTNSSAATALLSSDADLAATDPARVVWRPTTDQPAGATRTVS